MSILFRNIEAGYKFPPVVQPYIQSAIDHYALASLDMNPVHTNEEWAARAKVFGIPETVGHGMMTMSTLASVVTVRGEWSERTAEPFGSSTPNSPSRSRSEKP